MALGFKKESSNCVHWSVNELDKNKKKKKGDDKSCDELPSTKKRRIGINGVRYVDSMEDCLSGIDKKPRRGKVLAELIKLNDEQNPVKPTHVQRSMSSSSRSNPRVVLSQLIQNNVVLPGSHVCYRGGNGKGKGTGAGGALAEGWIISSHGIKCKCCNNVFGISEFEAHAGSKKHRPGPNIVLDDGRSLLDCQRQMLSNNKRGTSTVTVKSLDLIRRNNHQANKIENCDLCCVCQSGGEGKLILKCELCQSIFHKSCLCLKDVVLNGDWFCPSCCCEICGEGKFGRTNEYSLDDDDVVYRTCDQCMHKFHMGCIRRRGVKVKNYDQNKWFCSDRCGHIFSSLCELSGRPISLGVDDLNWRLLKSYESINGDLSANASTDSKVLKENKRKLNVAVDIMHECFEPAKDPLTGRDLVEDVIFNRKSEVKHKNFQGFYTVVLEKKGKIASVATVRVFEEVAEIPLVATKFKYRRNGMCRRLMDELEKQLFSLGVLRLILPAAPAVLNTWITKFGFLKMSPSERLKYLNYNFLDFQDTIMCQKLLMKKPTANLCSSGATCSKIADADIRFSWCSPISVLQAEQIENAEL